MGKRTSVAARQPVWPSQPATLLLIGLAALALLGLLVPAGALHTWWSVVVLGVVEGLTEFLPISSTAHLLIAADMLRFENDIGGTFPIFIQLGAVLAVLGYYARDLWQQARALPTSAEARHFWLALVVACLPAVVIGLLLRDWIKQVLFESPATIAWALIVGGAVMIAVERLPLHRATTHSADRTTLRQALVIGLAQVLALVPGVSRSASSIVGGMLAGLDRRAATAFSFYLAIPILGGATLVDLLGSLDALRPGDFGRLLVGTAVAMVVAWFSIGWLLRYVANHSFVGFGIYRIAAGLLILACVAAGWL